MERIFYSGDKIIPLNGFRRNMRFPLIDQVESYWDALRDGRALPDRADLDPRGLDQALPHILMLERIAAGQMRIRLSGQSVNALMGMDLRGLPLGTLFVPKARDILADIAGDLFDRPQSLRLSLTGENGTLEGLMLILPLRDDQGGVSRALACLATDGQGRRVPCRLRITSTQIRRLAPPPIGHGSPVSGFAETHTAFEQPARPHLRLVKSDSADTLP